jgi:hypothetical protein
MICNIHLTLSSEEYSQEQEEKLISQLIVKRRETDELGKVELIEGTIENFGVKISLDCEISITGSLAKFLLGTNAVSLTRVELLNAIFKLKQLTGLPLQKARLNGVEIGMNIFLKHLNKEYISFLKDTPG